MPYNAPDVLNEDRLAMRFLKWGLPLLILVVGVGVFWGFLVTSEAPEPLRPVNRAPVVSVQAAVVTSASPTLRIFGRMEAPTMSVLTAGVEADVVAVKALEGDAVRRGREMIVLDDVDAALATLQRRAEWAEIEALLESDRIRQQSDEAALKTEEALLALAHKAVERAAQLARSKAGSEAALDQAVRDEERQRLAVIQRRQAIDDAPARRRQLQARGERAEAAVKRAERAQRRTRVTAPFDGRITEVMVSVGDRTNLGSRLLELYDVSRLELRAQVPNAHIAALQRALDSGQPIIAVAANPDPSHDEPLEFVLQRLSAQVAAGQGGIDAFFRARHSDDGGLPAPGGTLEINLTLPTLDNVVLLSPDSLYGRARIYLVRDDALHSRTVRRLGQLSDDDGRQVLIVDGAGFAAGDEILNSRLPQAINGLAVRVAR